MIILKLILLFAIFFIMILFVNAQEFPDLKFQQLSITKGLSSNKVLCIAQDKQGLMWFGTDNGLNRYDGYRFKKFFSYNTDSTSLTSNYISEIKVDNKNNLWLSTYGGISYFNTNTQRTLRFRHHPSDPTSIESEVTPHIYINSASELPYLFAGSVYKFITDNSYQKIEANPAPYEFLGKVVKSYYGFNRDKKNRLWARNGNRIYLLDENTMEPLKTVIVPSDAIVQDFFFDDRNRCWVPCWFGGVFIYDEEKNDWNAVRHTTPGIGVFHKVLEWTVNATKFMVVSYEDGILLVNTKTGNSRFYDHTAFGKNIQYNLDVPGIFVDKQNILWLATNAGVFFVAASSPFFNIIPIEAIKKNDTSLATYVYNMKELASGFWLSKRYYGGIFWYDKNWHLKKFWSSLQPKNKNSLVSKNERLTEAYDFIQLNKSIFMSTNAGIAEMNLDNLSTKLYFPEDLKRLPSFRNIEPMNDSMWWIRSFDEGIFIFNPITKKFTNHFVGNDSCKICQPAILNYLLKTKSGSVFVTSFSGLYQFDKKENIFRQVLPINGSMMPSPIQKGIVEDKDGVIWVSTATGPYAYDPRSNRILKTFSEKENINDVVRITADGYNNIWFCSNTGYWCWLRQKDKLVHFNFDMGLPDIDDGIFYTTADGKVYGGGKDAVVQFYPERLMAYKSLASTKIVETNVNNQYKPWQTASARKYLELEPNENNITVDFAVINYSLTCNSQFFYNLSPGENGWQQNGDGHLSFNNLPPGKYTLQVRGADKVSGYFTDSDILNFIIRPRWYRTWWFLIFISFAVFFTVFAFFKWRVTLIKKQAGMQQKISETEMTALRAQMNPHFIFNCLNSIDSLIQNNEKDVATNYLAKFARLVRSILETSKNQTVSCADDLETLKLYLELEKLRWDNKFVYTIQVASEILNGDYKVPPQVIQPFVENAIHHGLLNKITPERTLLIEVTALKNHIHYIITDNGVGRTQAEIYKQLNKPSQQSMGIEITTERINLFNQYNNGSVRVTDLFDQNKQALGTRVEVILIKQ